MDKPNSSEQKQQQQQQQQQRRHGRHEHHKCRRGPNTKAGGIAKRTRSQLISRRRAKQPRYAEAKRPRLQSKHSRESRLPAHTPAMQTTILTHFASAGKLRIAALLTVSAAQPAGQAPFSITHRGLYRVAPSSRWVKPRLSLIARTRRQDTTRYLKPSGRQPCPACFPLLISVSLG